jgi:hypothetical protein
MSMATTLLDFILNLLRDSDAKAAFLANPEKALADAGLSDVCSEDVSDAMAYIAEYHPVSYVGNREYNVGNSSVSQHASSYQPDPPVYHPDPHATAVQQLEYVTNNYSYTDSHDTVIDRSVNQSIWNEGYLSQRFEDNSVTATDHSVAAGRDIEGNVATGDNNVVGNGNEIGNTTSNHWEDNSINRSFNGNNVADHGGVAGTNNDGAVTNAHNSNVATTGGEVDNSTHDSHDTTIRDSFKDSHDTIVRDSLNESHTDQSQHTTLTNSQNHESFNDESFNHDFNNQESYNHDSAITETEQHGLLNLNASPAVNVPVHHNDVLSDNVTP